MKVYLIREGTPVKSNGTFCLAYDMNPFTYLFPVPHTSEGSLHILSTSLIPLITLWHSFHVPRPQVSPLNVRENKTEPKTSVSSVSGLGVHHRWVWVRTAVLDVRPSKQEQNVWRPRRWDVHRRWPCSVCLSFIYSVLYWWTFKQFPVFTIPTLTVFVHLFIFLQTTTEDNIWGLEVAHFKTFDIVIFSPNCPLEPWYKCVFSLILPANKLPQTLNSSEYYLSLESLPNSQNTVISRDYFNLYFFDYQWN